jgi:hypothetical protein
MCCALLGWWLHVITQSRLGVPCVVVVWCGVVTGICVARFDAGRHSTHLSHARSVAAPTQSMYALSSLAMLCCAVLLRKLLPLSCFHLLCPQALSGAFWNSQQTNEEVYSVMDQLRRNAIKVRSACSLLPSVCLVFIFRSVDACDTNECNQIADFVCVA